MRACRKCNNDKNRLTLEEYRLVVAHRKNLIPNCDLKFWGEKQGTEAERG